MKPGKKSKPQTGEALRATVASAFATLDPEARGVLWLHLVEDERLLPLAATLGADAEDVRRLIDEGMEILAKQGAAGETPLDRAQVARALRECDGPPPPRALLRRLALLSELVDARERR